MCHKPSRSLLVSHWPVASNATVQLTTTMLSEYETNRAQGKAEAARKSMLALINTPNHPEYAHPIFWAPFVVVGEGGAGAEAKVLQPNQDVTQIHSGKAQSTAQIQNISSEPQVRTKANPPVAATLDDLKYLMPQK